jgi:epoxyqueuosine reductase
VAAYAWGKDYHVVLRQRMEDLMQRLQEKAERTIAYRCFTDSAPILERELAQRAGLGWIGKNTCLIHPHFGSYLFLAEIFTDLPLPPDPPFLPDRCGTCQRCIQACPTQCILPNRTLDARRCLSYLTIEHKSTLPSELRAKLGDWVFGCDICQQVCPWNQRVSASPSFPEFLPQPKRARLPLVEILSLSRAEFKQQFRLSPLSRPKWRGLSRNSAVVLGNLIRQNPSLQPRVAEFLIQALQSHPDPLVRQHLAWSLAQVGAPIAQQALKDHLQVETDPLVKAEIETLLQ